MNFRDAYEFDPETYAGEGGLLGRSRAVMQQQGAYPDATPNVAPGSTAHSSGSPQGGLLGRLLVLQAEQSRYQPVRESRAQPVSLPPNPNFRQLSRAPTTVLPQGTVGPSNLPDDQSNPAYSPFGEGAALDLLRTSQVQQNQYQPTAGNNSASQRRVLAQSIVDISHRLGINPEDLATAISYETAGTFDPWKAGPVTQHGQHRGLIQWGETQAREYGVTKDSTVPEQMEAVGRYLVKTGVTPGMKLPDIYSAINTGYVGRYGRSDANNGGAPGTVADKVAGMGAHRLKAARLLAEHAPPAFPAAPESPIRILSRRIVAGPGSFDSDASAPAWNVPSPMFDPRR
jgi:hypothetical protein